MLDFIIPLIGRFHPLIVHLPIGFILMALLLMYYPKKDKLPFLPAIEIALLWSCITAFLACISGFLLYTSEGYAFETVQNHLILGLVTALICLLLFFQLKKSKNLNSPKIHLNSIILITSLMLTGHLGGNLTHGEAYLVEVLPEPLQNALGYSGYEEFEPIALDENHWEEVLFYDQIIQPVFNQNCRSCHNPNNTKGGLLLTSKETILKGGKNGPVISEASWEEGQLYHRITLPLDHEDHMPPMEKRQPLKEELELIKFWLASGASFEKNLVMAGVTKEMVAPFFTKSVVSIYPKVELPKVENNKLSNIREKGFFIEPLNEGSSLMKVSCVNFPDFNEANLEWLNEIKQHIVYLDLSRTKINDQVFESLKDFENLTILKLNGTKISGNGLEFLQQCKHLNQVHLTETGVSWENLKLLNKHPKLEKIFAYKTPATAQKEDIVEFTFEVMFGNFELPVLPTDTVTF
ncbi:doubled CXXCH domain-containing protein [Aquiflexum balticum DSM 16537]|uniref:Doubled CXXCH domain-containing protein n=1 Tax=Aquiflexum balticum DSM 16537 TaxID=758820 RepID=A0A1W2HBW8_9BACT|nr:c-type cytochrome domain-containing protein [Aquiflexum balticum]SMD46375.1 doubled CXXCH domain-containing protein [Aquiflexum balticum DSM 16537]